ncbi:MAG: mechanosensitive ion channel, partial [Lactobacillales bacterium]|nr:mechanosensitive ion channel [Lactobacillales bacterium]
MKKTKKSQHVKPRHGRRSKIVSFFRRLKVSVKKSLKSTTRFCKKVCGFFNEHIFLFIVILFIVYALLYPNMWKALLPYSPDSNISFKSIFDALLFFLLAIFFIRFLKKFLFTRVFSFLRVSEGVKVSFTTLIGYAGFVIALFLSLSILGVDLKNMAIVFGALSVGIGFGLQNIVNNFVSGLVILFERPIEIGDWVVVKGNEGIVRRINIRSTEIETFDRATVVM